jgi:ferredoxin--NADP+ reductase
MSADGEGVPRSDAAHSPRRIAIIGAGPAGFYTAQHLLQQEETPVEVDLFDSLPTPFGLVRTGVAPDHPKIKAVTALYNKLALRPEMRFFGNVEFGKDLTLDEMRAFYHQIVFSNGAQADRKLGIPGEDLKGVHSAREFVAWYNGDPKHAHDSFELDSKGAVVVGVGNVAADVARILCRVHDKLAVTDIADYALKALDASKVKTTWVLGRRGPVQAKFSTPEIRELGEMVDTEASIPARDLELDELSQAELDAGKENDESHRNMQVLRELADRREPHKGRKLILRFLVSPVEILGDENGRVRGVKIMKNRLVQGEDGRVGPRATGETEILEAGLVFRSVGYKGVALPGPPFDERNGVIPNDRGRVFDPAGKESATGLYAAGWIKRGPSGLIGSNKACARETVEQMLADAAAGSTLTPAGDREAVNRLLESRGVRYITYQEWLKIDAYEVERGRRAGRPRVKLTELEDFLKVLASEAPTEP